MLFNVLESGGATITTTIPAVVLTCGGTSMDGINPDPITAIVPTPLNQQGDLLPSLSGTVYHPVFLLHLQFGADPANTLMDVSQSVTYALATQELTSLADGSPIPYNASISIASGTLTVNLTASQLLGATAIDGLYALGYLGIGFIDPFGNTGTAWYVFDYGTNAPTYQATPPSATGPLVITPDAAYQNYTFTWLHALPGTAPIAGYRLCWGSTPNGPFPNYLSLPISAWPTNTSSSYTYTAPAATFGPLGSTIYFSVEAFDDGSNLPSSSALPLQLVSYLPPEIPT
jgi:hypothetical protein